MSLQPDQRAAQAAMKHMQDLSARRERDLGRPLTDSEIEELENDQGCAHCGGHHVRACPRVRRIAWHPSAIVAEVEFWPADQIDWSGVIFTDQSEVVEMNPRGLDEAEQDDLDILLVWAERTADAGSERMTVVRRLRMALEEIRSYGPVEGSEPA